MDFHPVLVHFPIALLSLYAVLEIARFPFLIKRAWWFPLKAFLVIVGSLASLAAYFTGWLLKQQAVGELPALLVRHNDFAFLTIIVFGLLALAHLILVLRSMGVLTRLPSHIVKNLGEVAQTILAPRLAIPLALAGLVFVTITGALGGAMIYGPHVDPFVEVITKMLKLQ